MKKGANSAIFDKKERKISHFGTFLEHKIKFCVPDWEKSVYALKVVTSDQTYKKCMKC